MDAAAANTVPLDGELPTIPADVEDHPRTADFPSPMLWTGAVTPNYFRLMQIPSFQEECLPTRMGRMRRE